ncbi:TRAP transporter substrate-binding protein [Xanthobacter tagetidis]|jgi:tripartite ATP-independent transporter DctP family solute receptor|uniref:TRAP transporter substrate-binding protein n=1 Tax=Xanthobacter tagetidis TaxID=60216 RepID=A0A3L7AGJ4_9HYPH|nr:TRAP transporter substrate-binding protein [Xanthobacter tagetidis]MBB6306323.1 tripartite ATP-independent transporter DctP family solute receptor [Xanthobacter tagetidis]RLP79593.1 TRAP transporter substrate-binding protein [Xanthobacter tagetidis]
MLTRRHAFALAALLCAAPALPAFAQTTLKSADIHPDGYPTVEAVKYFGELVEKKTNGKYKVQLFFAGQLGGEKDTIEQTRFGVIDLNRINTAPFNNLIPETAVLGMPFLFRSVDHMYKVVDGPIGDEIAKAFEPQGLVVLGFFDSGARSIYNSKKPIKTLADMKGMKIRVQQSDLFIGMINALGANATPIPFGEVYSALQTGLVDGAENNYPSYDSVKHYEVAKYYSLTEHSLAPEVFVMSKRSWDKLTPDEQKAFKEAGKEATKKMRELWAKRDAEAKDRVVKGGAMINEVDKKPFIDAMAPVYDKFVTSEKMKDLVNRIKAVQ